MQEPPSRRGQFFSVFDVRLVLCGISVDGGDFSLSSFSFVRTTEDADFATFFNENCSLRSKSSSISLQMALYSHALPRILRKRTALRLMNGSWQISASNITDFASHIKQNGPVSRNGIFFSFNTCLSLLRIVSGER